MDQLQRQVDAQAGKLDREYDSLERMLDTPAGEETINLLLSQAKRVRTESGALVRALAVARDSLHSDDK